MRSDVSVVSLLKKTWQQFGEDHASRLGAALAYYTFTSFFPLLLVLISLIGLALSLGLGPAEEARRYVLETVSTTLPTARELIEQSIAETEASSGTLGLAGLLTGLWAASNIFAQLEESFNVIFDVSPRKKSFIEKLIARAEAGLIVILIAVLMMASFLFGTIVTTVESFALLLPGGAMIGWLLNLLLSLTLTALVFASLFRFLPDKPVTWKGALIGGFFTSVTWQIGRELLTWWLSRAGGVTAGTVVGTALAFLVLIYYASQIVLLGAELTATYDEMANPELVRDKTSEESALRGPGQPPVSESGQQVSRGRREGASSPQPAGRNEAPGSLATFGAGFVTGVLTLVVAGGRVARTLMAGNRRAGARRQRVKAPG